MFIRPFRRRSLLHMQCEKKVAYANLRKKNAKSSRYKSEMQKNVQNKAGTIAAKSLTTPLINTTAIKRVRIKNKNSRTEILNKKHRSRRPQGIKIVTNARKYSNTILTNWYKQSLAVDRGRRAGRKGAPPPDLCQHYNPHPTYKYYLKFLLIYNPFVSSARCPPSNPPGPPMGGGVFLYF